jgi:outer membrane protein OmpA-like peptidoglycan-associated protein
MSVVDKIIASAILIGCSSLACAAAGDAKGSKDHPLVSRFAGSTIVGYQAVAYDDVALPMGPLQGTGFAQTLATKGAVTRIIYASPEGKTSAEVMANYSDAIEHGGLKVLYSCGPAGSANSCGGYNFAHNFANATLDHVGNGRNKAIDLLYSSNNDVRYLAAELVQGDRKVDIGLLVAKNGDEPAGVMLQIVESGQMPSGQVTVDSAAMKKGLQQDGKIALYGLHFATDSAALEPDSDDTLKQMGDLLKQTPTMKVYIVGHTDDSGALAHNLTLSQQRAEAVLKALVSHYGIAADRMAAKGLASYSPVASNHDEAGKAKNRRVELVEQ